MEARTRLTCEQCLKRKRKCDKGVPCSACKSAGIQCNVVERARKPRGRSGRVSRTNVALETRVGRPERVREETKPSSNIKTAQTVEEAVESREQNHSRRPTGRIGKFVAPEFWAALSAEVVSIRETIEYTDDDEEEAGDSSYAAQQSETDHAGSFTPSTILTRHTTGCNCYRPSASKVANQLRPPDFAKDTLFSLYRDRVDPIFKVLHWPSSYADIKSEPQPGSASTKALEAAILYMAICSTSDAECRQWFFATKGTLVSQYRARAEAQLARTHILPQPSIAALQAFVIYVQAIRSSGEYGTSWTLLATASRLADALGLGCEDSEITPAFTLETRRRLWYAICLMDFQAAFDRGSVPLATSRDFGPPPMNINDSDMLPAYVPKDGSHGLTDMSFALMTYDAMTCQSKLWAVSSDIEHEAWAGWHQKQRLLADLEASYRDKYLALNVNTATPLHKVLEMVAGTIIANMKLSIRRPPYRQRLNVVPPWDDFDVLEVSTQVLEADLQLDSQQAAPWAWKRWPPWYALAVVLAELCRQPIGTPSDRAYTVAQQTFKRHAKPRADVETGMLWSPIAKLLCRVQWLRRPHAQEGNESADRCTLSPTVSDSFRWQPTGQHCINAPANAVELPQLTNGINGPTVMNEDLANVAPQYETRYDWNGFADTGQESDISWLGWDPLMPQESSDTVGST